MDAFMQFLPKLLGSLLILLIGSLITFVIYWVIVNFLKLIKIDDFFEPSGAKESLKKIGIHKPLSKMIGILFVSPIAFIVVLTFFNSLGLEAISDLLNQVVLFLPAFIIAMFFLSIGGILAYGVGIGLLVMLKNIMSPEQAKKAGWIAGVLFLLIFSVIYVLPMLGIRINLF